MEILINDISIFLFTYWGQTCYVSSYDRDVPIFPKIPIIAATLLTLSYGIFMGKISIKNLSILEIC